MAKKTFPFIHKGLIQAVEPGLLEDGQFQRSANITSTQAGEISVRLGSQRFANSQNFGIINSLVKMSVAGDDVNDARYFGEGTYIWRCVGPYTIYTNVTPTALGAHRFEAHPYHAGSGSKPMLFVAHPGRMMRDDGTFATLRPWGILPPIRPAQTGFANTDLGDYGGLEVLTDQSSGGSDRLSAPTVSTATARAGNYYVISPSSMAGILNGMYLKLDSGWVVVEGIGAASFYAYSSSTPSGTIHSYSKPVTHLASDDSVVAQLSGDGSSYYETFSGSADWSLNGDAASGYDSSDPVHFGVNVGDTAAVKEIRFRVFVGGSANDYYEYVVSVSSVQTAVWQEFDVAKNKFTKIGNAGQGAYTWKSVTGCQVYVKTNSISPAPSFDFLVGSVYAIGAQGPDSLSSATASAYRYVVCGRDPSTGALGNPCAEMVEENWVFSQRRAISVICCGIDTDATTGNPSISGFGSLAVYRAGGTFSDAYYRFIGYASNPGYTGGAPNTVTFVDNYPDSAIAGNDTVEFDNFPPVPSDLRVPFQATIASVPASKDGFQTISVTGAPSGSVSDYCQVGSELTLGFGVNEEKCIIAAAGTSTVTVWLQRIHYPGEKVLCSFRYGIGCDIVCQAGDALLVAGDPANPHKVYRSKAGRPTAFPVVNGANGNSHIYNIGSPENPILGIVEQNGEILFLNRSSMYLARVWNGAMTEPAEIARRGMAAKHLWCKVGGEVWFLSDDGIYSWSGGTPTKRSGKVNWIFNSTELQIGYYWPIDYTQLDKASIETFNGWVYVFYQDTLANFHGIRYSAELDIWEPYEVVSNAWNGSITSLLYERDLGRLVAGVYDNNSGRAYLERLEAGYTDHWTSVSSDGVPIPWNAKLGFISPSGRSAENLFQEICIEATTGDDVSVGVFYDFSETVDSTDQFTIQDGTTRAVPANFPLGVSSSISYGKEAKSMSIELSGTSATRTRLYSLGVTFEPLAEATKGRITDWQSCGHEWDKRLYELTIEYDAKGQGATLAIDTLSGVSGATYNAAVQLVQLSGTGRTKAVVPIVDGVIAKMVRLRPTVTAGDYLIYNWKFQFEPYPPDTVFFSEYDDGGYPYEKWYQQIVLDVDTGGGTATLALETESGTAQSINVTTTHSTRDFVYTLSPAITGRKMRIKVLNITAGGKFQLFAKPVYIFDQADKGPVIHTSAWNDLGHEFDKELVTITFEYENSSGVVEMKMDTLSGISGGTLTSGVQSFLLNQTGRAKQTFAINAGTVVKMIRLYPVGPANPASFKVWKYTVQKNDWPADTVRFTPWEDGGYQHQKIVQEVAFDVDTGGVAATVTIQSDGSTAQTFTVNTTSGSRDAVVTLNPVISGKKFKLLITPGANGKFQLWSWKFHFLKGDNGPSEHSFDYDNLAYPYDKRLKNVTFEYDLGAQGPVVMAMDTVYGVDGTSHGTAVQTFTLSGQGRCIQTFALTADTIVKMVKIYPQSMQVTFKVWKYVFEKDNLPPDTVAATDWDTVGWPCDKILRSISLDVDTGGVAASVSLQVDGSSVHTFSVTTTATNRDVTISVPSDIVGKAFRLMPTPGTGGKFQVYKVQYNTVREPCAVTKFDTYEITLGQAGWSFIKQMWVEYMCATPIVVSIYREGGVLFYQKTLPAHSRRDVENFLVPKKVGAVLNKSRMYRFTVQSQNGTTPFKLYVDSSRIESKNLSNDQRAGYMQHVLSTLTAPQAF